MKLSVSRSVSTESVGTDAIINASVIIDPTNLPPKMVKTVIHLMNQAGTASRPVRLSFDQDRLRDFLGAFERFRVGGWDDIIFLRGRPRRGGTAGMGSSSL